MKLLRFLFFFFLCSATSLLAAQAPKLETLLAEYQKARSDVLGKLNESYAGRADTLAEQYRAASHLDGTDRAQTFAKRLRSATEGESAAVVDPNSPVGDPLAALQADYAKARQENLNIVYTFYATNAANLRRELLKQKDQTGANVLSTFLEKIKPLGTTPKTAASQAVKARKASPK